MILKIMSISLLLNPTAKHNLNKSSTAGLIHSKRQRLWYDEAAPTSDFTYVCVPDACEMEVWRPSVTCYHSTYLSTGATDLLGTKECFFWAYVLIILR